MAAAWRASGSKADLRKELSEPVAQRILRPEEGTRDMVGCDVFLGFWPSKGHATTNVFCAIMQARPSHPETVTATGDTDYTHRRNSLKLTLPNPSVL